MIRQGARLLTALLAVAIGSWLAPAQPAEPASQPADEVPHLSGNVPEPAPPEAVIKTGPKPWQVDSVTMPEPPMRIFATPGLAQLSSVRIEGVSGEWYWVGRCETGFCANHIEAPHRDEALPAGALPGSHVATGKGTIARAWLSDPTQRLGDSAIGPWAGGTLVIQDPALRRYELDLGLNEAFEDLRPRIVSVGQEGDGQAAVFVVRSNTALGASLIAVTLEGEGLLRIAAQTAPIGRRGGWLNPVGAADFAGGGHNSIAIVVTPDSGGWLQILDYAERAFTPRFAIPDVSNHIPGRPFQDLAVVADFDGDNVPDIAVPDAARKIIRILTFAGGKVGEPADIPLPSPVATDIAGVTAEAGQRPMLLMGLEDGQLVVLH